MALELNRIYQGDCFIYLKNNIYTIIWGRKKGTNKQNPTSIVYQKVSKPARRLSAKFADLNSGEKSRLLRKGIVDFVQEPVILYGNAVKRKPLSINPIGEIAKIQIGKGVYVRSIQKYVEVNCSKSGDNQFLNAITGPVRNAARDVKKNIISALKHITSNHLQHFQNFVLMLIMESRSVKNAILSNQKGGMFIA